MTPIRIGLDIAKNVFQVHGVDDNGTVVIRKRLRRPDMLGFFASLPPCLIGIEACSASHHWARELIRLKHEVRLLPARYVKPYVQRGKSDALDAEAICEAVSRPTMRFATIKTAEQQAVLTLHRARELLVKQQTMLANLIRGCLGEFGIVAPLGIRRVSELIAVINDDADTRILPEARIDMRAAADQLCDLQKRIKEIEQAIRAWHRSNEASRRLATIPGTESSRTLRWREIVWTPSAGQGRFWLGTVMSVAGLCPACSRGNAAGLDGLSATRGSHLDFALDAHPLAAGLPR